MAATPDHEKTSMAFKKPLTFKFVEKTDGLVNYELTWPELLAKAVLHANQMILILHAMMNTIAIEDEAKRKAHRHAVGATARLTAEELETVFGVDQGAAWVPTTGTKGQDWILRPLELCKKALVKTQQPSAGDIVHCDIGATEHYKRPVESLSMTAIDEANNIMWDTFIKALRQHRQFDCVLTAGTAAHRIITKWRSDCEVDGA